MKQNYIAPEMSMMIIAEEDVIRTSATVSLGEKPEISGEANATPYVKWDSWS